VFWFAAFGSGLFESAHEKSAAREKSVAVRRNVRPALYMFMQTHNNFFDTATPQGSTDLFNEE
jgi:hypothetical protein